MKATTNKIETQKVSIQQLFKNYWFKVPEYQRSYVWQQDNVLELIEDIFYAAEHNPYSEYFLGSLVLQRREVNDLNSEGISYYEYDLLDGQQRLTTILLILAVVRDLTGSNGLAKVCTAYIYQQEDEFQQIPERLRMVYKIRDNVESFIQKHIKSSGGTSLTADLEIAQDTKNISISNMAKAILCIQDYFRKVQQTELEKFAKHLFNNVIVIYVASEELEDAFRLFTILNNRGVPLTNADILKSLNLGEVAESLSTKIAQDWEELESSMGSEDFNRLLSFIRTIYVKDKARENIVKEFNERIYNTRPPLLKKGKETFDAIFGYADVYKKLILLEDLPADSCQFKNLITVMRHGFPSNDWIPPLLCYYKKFQHNGLLDFTKKLGNKFSADWMSQLSPSSRINNMANVLRAIEKADSYKALLLNDVVFNYSIEDIKNSVSGHIYRKRFGKYILLLLEYLMHDHSSTFPEFSRLSVEHILPQSPSNESKWKQIFTDDEMVDNVHKLGNLVLISRSKNSSLGRKDFLDKKRVYFNGSISAFPNSLQVMQYNEWDLPVLQKRQADLLEKIIRHFR
ncbi:DUF262 domain-containing protein [Parapedobacter deserti]|uniref:DUF262 domain-containing protein n=1 Tax=Parapedobacter deserti TaxID=1912957 RepID=A0ABV7JMY5_9SPHI